MQLLHQNQSSSLMITQNHRKNNKKKKKQVNNIKSTNENKNTKRGTPDRQSLTWKEYNNDFDHVIIILH